MRHFFSIRLWKALGAAAALSLVLLVVNASINGYSSQTVGSQTLRNIDLIASVSNLQADKGWAISGYKTVARALPILDDGRTMLIAANTPGEITCADLTTSSACVLLADTLGGGIVWFALVPTDAQRPLTNLNLPALVDMQDGGNLGVLANGWIIKLADLSTGKSSTKRTCDTETKTLREFINTYSPDRSTAVLDLIADQISEVICVKS